LFLFLVILLLLLLDSCYNKLNNINNIKPFGFYYKIFYYIKGVPLEYRVIGKITFLTNKFTIKIFFDMKTTEIENVKNK